MRGTDGLSGGADKHPNTELQPHLDSLYAQPLVKSLMALASSATSYATDPFKDNRDRMHNQHNRDVDAAHAQARIGFGLVFGIFFGIILITNVIGFFIHKSMSKNPLDPLRPKPMKIGLLSILGCWCGGCWVFLCFPIDEDTTMLVLQSQMDQKQPQVVMAAPQPVGEQPPAPASS